MAATSATTTSDRPIGVLILAVLSFIAGAFLLLGGIIFIAVGGTLVSLFSSIFPSWLQALLATLGLVIGIILLALAVCYIIVGKGLLDGKPWAWTLTLVLTAISAINGVMGLLSGNFGVVVSLAINGLIIWYLFTPEVKAFFGKSSVKTPWEKAPAKSA